MSSKKKFKKQKSSRRTGREFSVSDVIDIGFPNDDNCKFLSDLKEENVQNRPEKITARKKKTKKRKSDNIEQKRQDDNDTNETKKLKTHLPMIDMSAWDGLFVPEPVLRSLAEEGFTTPTEIQRSSLPSSIRDRMDIVGAAETGSGKTLAFGIPIIHHILELNKEECLTTSLEPEDSSQYSDEINAESQTEIIELAIGVDDRVMRNVTSADDDFDLPPDDDDAEYDFTEHQMGCVRVMNNVTFDWLQPKKKSSNKNNSKLLLALVLTPTRELAMQIKSHLEMAARHTDIKVAVVVGGMSSQKQERLLRRQPEIVVATPGRLWELVQAGQEHLSKIGEIRYLVVDEADRMAEKGHYQELTQLFAKINADEQNSRKRQTFIFSATLTLVHDAPQRSKFNKKKFKAVDREDKLKSLISLTGIKKRPKVIDLSRKEVTATGLTESRITCDSSEKDYYLFYFLLHYPGRTLVFVNSKDCVRRLVSIFSTLGRKPLRLHADMPQPQRLDNLEKFKKNQSGLLLATDCAGRGLDVPDVMHVIHYQVPRTSEGYVHRSGRTARANKSGLSVMLVAPEELQAYRRILTNLAKSEDLKVFPVESEYLNGVKTRVNLAREIDLLEHSIGKLKAHNNWFRKAAEDVDIELDEDELLHDLGDQYEEQKRKRKVKDLRNQLEALLRQPLVQRRFLSKYPTKSGQLASPYMKDLTMGDAVKKLATSGSKKRPRNTS